MPLNNTFNRTIVFAKVPLADGKKVLKRIPWDLIGFGSSGFMVSQMPVPVNFDTREQTADYVPDIADMLIDPAEDNIIDNVVEILYFESEEAFIARFEGAFGHYVDGDKVSAEFGYPRT